MTHHSLNPSSRTTRLILVRHGQTACNVADIWHGWDECELTEAGLAQARAVGMRLASEPVAAVYSSDSPRALQTATAIARHHHLEPIPLPALRERHAGDYEGMTISDIIARNPRIWEERDADYWNWSPPGGEAFTQVLERAYGAVREIHERHPGETVVAVSHMSTVRALISLLADMPVLETHSLKFPSTAMSIFRIDGDRAEVELLDDGTHLSA
jgi:broad specificity phosphatase PhoE